MKSTKECIDYIIDLDNASQLLGLYSTLKFINAPHFLCLSGLFLHTNLDRVTIQNCIGKEAEELVNLFRLFSDKEILMSNNINLIYLGYVNSIETDNKFKSSYENYLNNR